MDKREKFAAGFYHSAAWAICRKKYAESVGGLCERCMARGKIVPGEQVHHKKRLTPRNIGDPAVTMGWDNLELLCLDCHQREHEREKRYRVNPDGHVDL